MTVTRVLHGSPLVRDATRKKVLAVCRRLNYRPNLIARSLRMQKSHVLGVVVPTLMHDFFARLISAIERRANTFGYHILVTQLGGPELRIDKISFLFEQRVGGLFVATRHCGKSAHDYLKSGGIPVVFLDQMGPKNAVFIGTDDYRGAVEATSHLIALGHRRIAHLAGGADTYTGRQRAFGYQAALKAHGIAVNKEDIVYTDYSSEGGYKAAEQILRSKRKYTAVFCANDYIAIGLLSWANRHGIQVPAQLSVIGFTGDEVGQYSAPPLTTMVQPTELMGARAVESMIALIEKKHVPGRILLKPELLIRDSTAKSRRCYVPK